MDIKKQFDEIVNELWEVDKYYFSYTEEANCESISFKIFANDYSLETTLWHSELDDRIFNEKTNQYEPLKDYLKRQIKTVLGDLNTFNKLWK